MVTIYIAAITLLISSLNELKYTRRYLNADVLNPILSPNVNLSLNPNPAPTHTLGSNSRRFHILY